ncbi:MAG: FliI/YscN family ATPase [Deltaproteobacteria bacterium]|nr:FliI/YscN family ATPase [Deltaproteobacteria bacterium]
MIGPAVDLRRYLPVARAAAEPAVEGRLSEVVGLVLEARGCRASIGDLYELRPLTGLPIEAEVVGLRGDRTLLMPLGHTQGLEVGSPLRRVGRSAYARVGSGLLGRVLDGLGRPLDGQLAPELDTERPLYGASRNPLRRRPVSDPFWVGVRAIDGLLTLGKGQRIGIFAGGGVGKSSLLGMMVRRAKADVAVVALIGERGREVEEFVHRTLGPEGLARSVVVAATSAEPPLVRVRGALYATTIAEHFRAKGLDVLLVMDSLTRFAMAMREVGLAIGEPPTTKGYTPTVFASMPRILERAGTSAGPGSITGVYTVLVEGDDLADPIADSVRATLDGHVVLSRTLAERGHFPAIDLPQSISRVLPNVVSPRRVDLAHKARELLGTYREAEDLVAIGAYKQGTLPRLDEALFRMPKLEKFLRQGIEEPSEPDDVEKRLAGIWSEEK